MRTEQEVKDRLNELIAKIKKDQETGNTTEWRLAYMTALSWVLGNNWISEKV